MQWCSGIVYFSQRMTTVMSLLFILRKRRSMEISDFCTCMCVSNVLTTWSDRTWDPTHRSICTYVHFIWIKSWKDGKRDSIDVVQSPLAIGSVIKTRQSAKAKLDCIQAHGRRQMQINFWQWGTKVKEKLHPWSTWTWRHSFMDKHEFWWSTSKSVFLPQINTQGSLFSIRGRSFKVLGRSSIMFFSSSLHVLGLCITFANSLAKASTGNKDWTLFTPVQSTEDYIPFEPIGEDYISSQSTGQNYPDNSGSQSISPLGWPDPTIMLYRLRLNSSRVFHSLV